MRTLPFPRTTIVVALLYAGIVATFMPFTWPMRLAVALPCASVAAMAVRRGWHRRGPIDDAPVRSSGLAIGLGLVALVGAFQLAVYVSSPRADSPTMSSLASQVFGAWPVRATAFFVWLALGWYLVER